MKTHRLCACAGLAVVLMLALPLSAVPLAVAAPGDLDPSFGGGDGIVTTDFNDGWDYSKDMVLDSSGRIVVVGIAQQHGGNQDFGVVRYLPDGSLDTSFGSNGKVTTAFGDSVDEAYAVALDGVGRVVVSGWTYLSGFAVTRYDPDGSLDTTFSDDGKVTTMYTGYDYGYAVAIDDQGRIIVAGGGASSDVMLVRYNADGSLDPSFGANGVVVTDYGSWDYAFAVVLDSAGRILVAGTNGGYFLLGRYSPDGVLDTTFDHDGKVTTDLGSDDAEARAIVLDNSGRIVVAGWMRTSPTAYDFALARYNPDGSLDASLGGTGIVITDVDARDEGRDVVLDSNGRIVVSGYVDPDEAGAGHAPHDFAILRYQPNGCLDSSFSGDGKAITDFSPIEMSGAERGQAVALDGSGRIVVAGSTFSPDRQDTDITVVRYLGGGTAITAFKQNTEGAALKDWLMTLAGPEPKSGQTMPDGCITWAVTQPGAYTLTEEDQAGWTPQGATSADFTVVSDGGPYSHTFVNFQDVTITACKQSIGGSAIKDWLMTLSGPDPKSGTTLADGCITWSVTKPGAYTVTEEDQAGWTPQGATSADFTVVSGGGPYSHTFVNFRAIYLPLIMR